MHLTIIVSKRGREKNGRCVDGQTVRSTHLIIEPFFSWFRL